MAGSQPSLSAPMFPIEIWDIIFSDIDCQDVVSIRASCKFLKDIADRRLFSSLSVTNSSKSARAFLRRVKSEAARKYVKMITFTSCEFEWGMDMGRIRKVLGDAFECITSLSRLEHVRICFRSWRRYDSHYGNAMDMHELQTSILTALLNSQWTSSGAARTLNIQGLFTANSSAYGHKEFDRLAGSLTSFHVHVVRPSFIKYAIREDFWDAIVLRKFLASATTLTALSLDSESYFGLKPPISLAEVHFPALTSLSLRHVQFCAHSGATQFVLNHKTKLRCLALEYCSIVIHATQECKTGSDTDSTPPKLWSTVFGTFATNLESLVRLDVDYKLDPAFLNYVFQTTPYQFVGSYIGLSAVRTAEAADRAALEKFRETVTLRRASGG
ncbi:hypothetical protein K488DRAFT_90722 [Vararia minispora EC-137]|uniref:Uncharacterized protein n=1 Tax=Vararia minispora EC-137 TaxID=1314806 RepID=A0ACB8Q6W0_9AGAM|nr:hypothetical protein K488DRAFT_90722 [Vararia minispora EC-137]